MKRFLPDVVYGANDGLVTTFAIISGVTGAGLSSRVILILGFASVVADGSSMGASDYLSERSKAHERPERKDALRHGVVTFVAFVVVGVLPLLSYLVPISNATAFVWASGITGALLFGIGAGRASLTGLGWWMSGLEMLLVGAVAAVVAYGTGAVVSAATGSAIPEGI